MSFQHSPKRRHWIICFVTRILRVKTCPSYFHWCLLLVGGLIGCESKPAVVNPPNPTPTSQVVVEGPVYTIGVVPQWGSERLFEIWQPLVNYLSDQTGLNLKLEPTFSIPNFEKGFTEGEYDFAYMNPYHFVCAQRDEGYMPLIRDDKRQLTGILVAANDSDIKSVEQLEGQRVDFPSPNALGASLYMRTLLARKFNVECVPKYVQTHESVYLNVISGKAAAGGGVRRTLEAQVPELQERLRVIYETPGVAPHPLAYHPRVPEEVAAKVKAAIIEMTNSEEGRTLLAGIPMTKPATATDEDYQSLVDLKLEEFYQAPE